MQTASQKGRKVDRLLTMVDKLLSLTQDLVTKREDDNKRLSNIDLEQIVASEGITTLVTSVSEIQETVKKIPTQCSPIAHEDEAKTTSSLWGDSLVKDVVSNSPECVVFHMNGKKIADVKASLDDETTVYDDMYIVIGTNDCGTKTPEAKIMEDYKSMIDVAKQKAKKVVISSIPPRGDGEQTDLDAKIRSVNSGLKDIAEAEGIVFVDNDANFRYANGEMDDNLLQVDKLHLSENGVTRLLKNMGLTTHVKCKLSQNVPRWPKPNGGRNPKPQDGTSPVLFRSHTGELSNFYPCTLNIYGDRFTSSEAAYQYAFAVEHDRWDLAQQIKSARNAAEAKNLSKKIPIHQIASGWNEKKVDIMKEILEEKFNQCQQFREKLKQTGKRPLVENTNNPFWARGPDGNGQNKLGVLLMELRDKMFSDKRWSRYLQQKSVPQNHDDDCEYCGESNHTTRRCRHGKYIACLDCGELGHKRKKCSHH